MQSAIQRGNKVVTINRFQDVVIRSTPQGLNCEIMIAMAGDQQRECLGRVRNFASNSRPSMPGILISLTMVS